MGSPPRDLEPDEQDFYELFGELRRELGSLAVELAGSVLTRIELFSEDERSQNPEPVELISSALSQFVNLITSWRKDKPSETADEDEGAPTARSPKDDDESQEP